MRFGELTELRRRDVDLGTGDVRVERAVVRVAGGYEITTPKSDAGVRTINIPDCPDMLGVVVDHLDRFTGPGEDDLLFPGTGGQHLANATLKRHFYHARNKIGRPDLRLHDLRHTGAVLYAQTGATLADLQARLGHSTVQAAMRYQSSADGRDRLLARKMAELAVADTADNVISITDRIGTDRQPG